MLGHPSSSSSRNEEGAESGRRTGDMVSSVTLQVRFSGTPAGFAALSHDSHIQSSHKIYAQKTDGRTRPVLLDLWTDHEQILLEPECIGSSIRSQIRSERTQSPAALQSPQVALQYTIISITPSVRD